MPNLEASGVHKRFGGVVALAGAGLELRAGEVHALIGSNGCGKSTLCKIIAGAVGPDEGRIVLDGRPVAFASPREATLSGIGVFYQELSLIPQMTVAENILLGREPRKKSGLIDRRALRESAWQALASFQAALGSGVDPEAPVASLSPDQAQIVELLKVLSDEPRILILDEATAALGRDQVNVVFERVRALKAQGRSIIFITHRMDEVFEIADRVTVMRNGETLLSRPAAEITRDELVRAMVGTDSGERTRSHRRQPQEEFALEVDDLSAGKVAGVSFRLRRGEILGFGGLHGQGQSEVLRALFGALAMQQGRIRLHGQAILARTPLAAMRRSIAYVSGDRARHGVMAIRPIFENLVISLLGRHRRAIVARRQLESEVAPFIERLKLKFSTLDAPVSELSGGNQQKVVIARWLATQPLVLLLDDPTKGIDIQTKADLYRTMDELCAQGMAIVLHSSDDEELLGVADRVLVFNGGRVVAELQGEQRTRFELYRAAYTAEATRGAT